MGTIVIKDGDALIPDDALQVFFKKFSKGSALAFASEGTLEMSATRSAYTSMEEALKDINDVQCPLKKETLVYYFTNYPDKLMDEDVQPYIILADKDEKGEVDPLMVAIIDGAVSDSFEPDASGHTREYMAVNSYLAPKLQKLYAACGEDLENLWKELSDPIVKRELISALFDDTGDLVLLDATGEVRNLSYKSQEKDFPWGWVSDPCGYGEVPDKGTIDQSIKDAGKSVLQNIKAKGVLATLKAGVAAAATSVPVVKPDTATEPSMVWVRPPKHVRSGSNNQKSKWYDQRVAVRPGNWKDCPPILLSVERATKEALEVVKQPDKALPDGVHAVPDKKDTTPHHIPDPSSPIVVIPPAQQAYVVDEFLKSASIKKHLDANSQAIPNPAEMSSEESKRPTFCDKAGLSGLEKTLRWDGPELLPLFKNAPEAALTLYLDTRSAYINQLSEKPKTVEEPVVVKPSTPATQAPVTQVIKRRQRM